MRKKSIIISLVGLFLLVAGMLVLSACVLNAGNIELTFKVDDEAYHTITTTGNTSIKLPQNPTKTGYAFDGWYRDENVWGSPFSANSLLDKPISSDMSVYAKWEMIDYYISYNNLNNATNNNPKSYTVESEDFTIQPLAKEGYTFDGWFTNSECTIPADVNIEKGSTGNITLYAKWTINAYFYTLKNGAYELTAYNGTESIVDIPKSINGIPVTSIASNAFRDKSHVTSVTIPDSITTIGEYAFYGCDNLTNVYITDIAAWCNISFGDYSANPFYNAHNLYLNNELVTELVIPNSVTSIGNYAFYGCDNLMSVTIGNSVTSIGNYAFQGCNSLTSVYITDIAAWCNISFGDFCANPFYYAHNLYLNNELVTELVIPDGVKTIGKFAFYACSSLTSVTIPASVTSIGNYAFDGCESLTSVYITDMSAWCNISFAHYSVNPLYYAHNLYLNKELVTELVIPNSVTSIGSFAFYDCDSLTSVTFGSSVTTIGNDAFYDCSSLTSVTIGKNVTSIGASAFRCCYRLVEVVNKSPHITIEKGFSSHGCVGDYAFDVYNSGDTFTSKLLTDNGCVIYTDGNEKILVDYVGTATELTLPDGITQINQYALYGRNNLTSVTIPASVTTIGDYAFYGCSHLTSIVVPDSVKTIGEQAFYDCDSLTNVTIGNSVTTIGYYSFYDCDSLISVIIGNSVTTIDRFTFYGCDNLTSVTIGNSVTIISDNAFYGCESLTSIVIPDSVHTIENYAFYGCSNLTSVTIGSGVTTIGDDAFYGCESLTSIVIPDGVKTIENRAFYGCSNLTSVTIGNSVTRISDDAFYGCESLTSVTIGNSVTSIGASAFENCYRLVQVVNKSTHMTITKGLSSNGHVGYYAVGVYNSGDTVKGEFLTDNGCVIYTDGNEKILVDYVGTATELTLPDGITQINKYAFYGRNGLTSIVLPNSVKSIGEFAFYGCDNLTSVTIGNSVTTIGENAFYGCNSLTSIVLPNSVKSIGDFAFYGCDNLTSVTIGNSVTTIGENAFYGCSGLTSVYITDIAAWCNISFGDCYANPLYYAHNLYLNNNLVTELVIPNSVTSIGQYVFYGCNSLKSVTIGNSVTTIGDHAFYGCGSLTSVTIGSGVTTIGYGAFDDCNALTSVTFTDTSTWYRTTNKVAWQNKTDGALTDVTSSSTNATYFKSTYAGHYWYKV